MANRGRGSTKHSLRGEACAFCADVRLTFSSVAFGALLALGPALPAQESMMEPSAPAVAAPAEFADLSTLDVARILPPPPEADSLTTEADLRTLLQVQAERTPQQVEWAKLVAEGNMFTLFGAENLLGPDFTREARPQLGALLGRLITEARPLNVAVKEKFHRPRPFVADARLHPCVERPSSDSYPSGHSFTAFLWAAVLAELHPDLREAIYERADHIVWGRIVGGVHYPTDLAAGRRLAQAVIAEEMKNAAFRAALEKCRAEAAAPKLKKAA